MIKIYFKLACLSFLFTISVTLASAQKPLDAATKAMLVKQASKLGVTSKDVNDAVITNSFKDEKFGIEHIYIQQAYNEIKVYNQLITIAIKNGVIAHAAGSFVENLGVKANGKKQVVDALTAIKKAARHLNLPDPDVRMKADKMATEKRMIFSAGNISRTDVETALYWVVKKDTKEVVLCWNVNINRNDSPDWKNVRINAVTGAFVEEDNWTINEFGAHDEHENNSDMIYPFKRLSEQSISKKFNATIRSSIENTNSPSVSNGSYNVFKYPLESPLYGASSSDSEPWLKAGNGNNANTFGWHFDGTLNFTTTQGNNVHAYEDRRSINTPASANSYSNSSSGFPAVNYNDIIDMSLLPVRAPNDKAAINNLFYWNNITHNILYQYGFTEAAGNFQTNNMGRGGNGNDYVQAEAQDGSGANNANFATPVDGLRPRMQMFLWPGKTRLTIHAPSQIAQSGNFVAESHINVNNPTNKLFEKGPVSGQIVLYKNANNTSVACLPAINAAEIAGKIAMIDMTTTCNILVQVKNAQNAGAIAVFVKRTDANGISSILGNDPTITIPAVMINQSNGNFLTSYISSGLFVTISSERDIDGDFDNGIIVHEYGHGVSNRLTAGPANASCLGNREQAGEGWSDYISLMLTTDWSSAQVSDGIKRRPIGNFALAQTLQEKGIRRFPYSTDMSISPLTYNDLPVSSIPHGVGEIWCATIWDMTWNIIEQEGTINPNLYNANSNGGNSVAFNLVMQGMKLQPCGPGLLNSRDAILAADELLYNGKYKCAIWKAFARRGMGVSASQGSPDAVTDQTVAFDLPSGITLNSTSIGKVNEGENITVNYTATCGCDVPASTNRIRHAIPTGFSYVSSTGGSVDGDNVFFPLSFAKSNEAISFSVTLKADMAGCFTDTPVNDDRDNTQAGGFTPVRLSGNTTLNWAESATKAKSGTKSWFSPSAASASQLRLVSQQFQVGATSILSFWHQFNSELGYDGARVLYSINNGTTWLDAGPLMIQNGYNTTMLSGGVYTGRAFSGSTNGLFINTLINLSTLQGSSVRIAFETRTDAIVGSEGWYVDDIVLTNGCGAIHNGSIVNATNTSIASVASPTFVTIVSPVITCPSNIIVNTDQGKCTAAVSFSGTTAATATGVPLPLITYLVNNQPITLPYDFPKGNTTVIARASNSAGTADCSFTVSVIDEEKPTIVGMSTNITVGNNAGVCGAKVNYTIPVSADNCTGHSIARTAGPASGDLFPLGTTTVTFTATDAVGNTLVQSFTVTVNDTQKPTVTGLTANQSVLWPPNHKMKDVAINYTTFDNCNIAGITVSVTSTDPVNGTGDGDTGPDWEVVNNKLVRLRAERAATGDGRIYTIRVVATDAAGNVSDPVFVNVVVSHNIVAPISGTAVKVGTSVDLIGNFWDVPGNKHTATWDIDGTIITGSVVEPSGMKNGIVRGTYKFTTPGVYKLKMNVTDQNKVTTFSDMQGDLDAIVVVYDPNGGYTFGGGWFQSPAGALSGSTSASGKVSFGFQSNYFKNATNPKGETQLEFKVGGLEFNALNFEYLAISGAKAQFRGTGRIIGDQSGYAFIMTVIDGGIAGGDDKIRMKIFNKNTGKIIYDNQPGASDAADPVNSVGSGSIITIMGGVVAPVTSTVEQNSLTIEEVADGLTVKALPNPSMDHFTLIIRSNSDQPVQFRILDVLGRTIENKQNIASNTTQVVGAAYLPGVYYAEITQGGNQVKIKLVKRGK